MFGRPGLQRQRLRFRGPHMKVPTINRLIPNAVTVLAMCVGLTALRFGMMERWDLAIFCILVAGILDFLDGRIARMINGTSKFGAELDSLADFVGFGAVPALLIYMASLHEWGGYGWAVALIYAVCCALRLARFNTAIGDPNPPPWAGHYFVGVPAPAGAALAILPLMATVEFGTGFFDRPAVNAIVLLGVAALMISRVPTFSVKQVKINSTMALPLLLLVTLLAAALASAPFRTFIVLGVVYIACIPLAVWMQRRARRAVAVTVPTPPTPTASEAPRVDPAPP